MASEVEQSKKQMRIALVGVRPADQITLKGYLRVLLRLDVELFWVSATDSPIDLFMINEEFQGVASVTKLLQTHSDVPVLYVDRVEVGDGGINQNVLTLPLKQINLLNDWLVRHVAVLSGSLLPTGFSTTTKNAINKVEVPESSVLDVDEVALKGFISFIKELQARQGRQYELLDGERLIAMIDVSRQRVWIRSASPTISTKWSLRPYHGQTLEPAQSLDLIAWLWQIAWQNTEALTPLVDANEQYQLRYWIKPPMNEMRRSLLQIMTVMEMSPVSVVEVAARAGVSVAFAKKAVASLLFAGSLMDGNYQRLKVPVIGATTASPPVIEKAPEPPPVTTPQQEEKMGFLARLRRKLGL